MKHRNWVRITFESHKILECPDVCKIKMPNDLEAYAAKLSPGMAAKDFGNITNVELIRTDMAQLLKEANSETSLWKSRFWGILISFIVLVIGSTAVHVYYILKQQWFL